MEFNTAYYAVLSIAISVSIFAIAKYLVSSKLSDLKGTQKLLGLISIIIIGIEMTYLGVLVDLFTLAASAIASLGVAFALITFALQNHLKNIVSGIGLYMNKRINTGDVIEIDGKKGTITEFHLMKTIAITDNGEFMNIPNLKFNETVILITRKDEKSR